MCITSAGAKTTFVSDKRGIIQRFQLGVPIRDMRLMDAAPGGATLGDAAFILVRDNAAVVCIDYIRFIATADCVILPTDGLDVGGRAAAFVAGLQEAIVEHPPCSLSPRPPPAAPLHTKDLDCF